ELVAQFGAEVAAIVMEVTDDKALPKAERKQLQVEHAAHASAAAKHVKLADKICNLRDIAGSPPAGWSLERKQEYFDWAKRVIDALRGVNPKLEAIFDAAYAARP
ncbi:MAG: HD domain-containing protein, partial [Burkholderiaceae bacterium]|nr:HD domain-containing protein [Burkholderiaceae bacterium]